MCAKRVWANLLSGCFAFSAAALFINAGSPPKQDRSWKRYYNPQWGYCLSYPDRWRKGDAFEGAGIFIETGVKRLSVALGEIDIAALQKGPQINLVDNTQVHLEGLRKFERAEHIEQLEQRPLQLLGNSALFTKSRYYDPLERVRWVEEIVFTQRQNVLYRMELECRADQLERFEPVFSRVLSSFEFDCAPRGAEARR